VLLLNPEYNPLVSNTLVSNPFGVQPIWRPSRLLEVHAPWCPPFAPTLCSCPAAPTLLQLSFLTLISLLQVTCTKSCGAGVCKEEMKDGKGGGEKGKGKGKANGKGKGKGKGGKRGRGRKQDSYRKEMLEAAGRHTRSYTCHSRDRAPSRPSCYHAL
jgi:hypothetical protein